MWCVNLWHIAYELSQYNSGLQSKCEHLLQLHSECGCGMRPACLVFRHELYAQQMAAAEELLAKVPELWAHLPNPLPTCMEFKVTKNMICC